MKNYDVLKYIINNNNIINSILEIGVASGSTTKLILEDNSIMENINKFVGIDPRESYIEKIYKNNIDLAKNNYKEIIKNSIVEYYNNYSINMISKFINDKNYFDCIIIDGCHLAKNVMEDLVLSFNILNKNGYLIVDDYLWFPTIKISVRKIEDSYKNFNSTPIHKRCKDVIDMFIKAYQPYIKVNYKFKNILIIKKI